MLQNLHQIFLLGFGKCPVEPVHKNCNVKCLQTEGLRSPQVTLEVAEHVIEPSSSVAPIVDILNDLNSENLQLLEVSYDLEGWTHAIMTCEMHAYDCFSLCRDQGVDECSRGQVVPSVDDESRLREGFQGSFVVDLSTDLEQG